MKVPLPQLLAAIAQTRGDMSAAARLLGISRQALTARRARDRTGILEKAIRAARSTPADKTCPLCHGLGSVARPSDDVPMPF